MVAREIAPLHFVVCAAPAYLARHAAPGKPSDLLRHNCLRLGRPGIDPGGWSLGRERSVIKVKGNLVAGDIVTLGAAAVHGQGVALLPLPFALPLFREGKLTPLLTDCVARHAQLFIHYPNRKGLPARVRSFVDFMLERLRANPDLTSDPRELLAPFGRLT